VVVAVPPAAPQMAPAVERAYKELRALVRKGLGV
jgi:hypothetical protein